MTELLTGAQMRAIEQAAIESGEVTGLELMERAGQGVLEAILEWRPELAMAPHRAVVLCGPGNNGGDGFVVARLLKQRGWEVEVYLYGDEANLPSDAAQNARRWRELGGIRRLTAGRLQAANRRASDAIDEDRNGNPLSTSRHTVYVDALFGTGLSRPLQDDLFEILRLYWFDHCYEYGVAIDFPSGICADSGQELGGRAPVYVPLTVTFQQPKLGHMLGRWNEDCLRLTVVDLGIGCNGNTQCQLLDENVARFELRAFWNRKLSSRHKYSHGHALVLSGGSGKGGAARLAARGALRIGAGLVTVGCPEEALTENAARLDAVMLAPMQGADELQAELDQRKVKAICIGPGFGLGGRLREFLKSILTKPTERSRIKSGTACSKRPRAVLDADALTEFRDDPETLFAMLHDGCVLTPHEGEFGRLFPDILAKLHTPTSKGPAFSKVDATREAAKRAGCVVLFKGADTVIANPDGRCSINSAHYERWAPWLATAGSGDVLAGFITGLLARGFDPMTAAETGAWLHVACALKFGPGLIAEDLPEQLPAVFRDLGL